VVDHVTRESPNQIVDPFHLSLLESTRVEQRTVSREPLRKLSERTLTPGEARAVAPRLLGLPRDPRSIVAVRWNAGTAYRLDYGTITVWNFTTPIPPSLVADLAGGPEKVIPLGRNVARFYPALGLRLLVEVDTPSWSVAIEAPGQEKIDVFRLARSLRPLG
jgi:hypothetical protein